MATSSSSALEPTIEISKGGTASGSHQLALDVAGSSQLSSHEHELLRVRVKTAAFVLFIGFGSFLLLWLIGYNDMMGSRIVLLSHLTTTATLGLSALSLCRSCDSKLRLRVEEAIVFGSPASFLALAAVMTLLNGARTYHFLPDTLGPWIMLVFTYALFIPNRPRRAIGVIVSMSIVPVVIVGVMLATSTVCQQAENANLMYFVKTCIVMLMTAVIASTGAARIGTLRREAFAAKELGQYRLKERIGRGGMGEVYLAEHRLIKRPCAVKLIRSDRATDPQAIARFEREVQTAANLTHWNSVNVYDYGHAEDGTFYFVMEYLPGMSLQELVDTHGPLSSARTIYFLRQICGALQEAHEMNFVHRDLKPANIFAAKLGGEQDVAKLLDFGLAKDVAAGGSTELTMFDAIAGSPLFMAPEIATGDAEPGVRSDIYSLGCVAYFLLTGQPPFPGDNPIKVLMAHANDPLVSPSRLHANIAPDLESIVLRCLEKDPETRIQSAGELAELLDTCRDAHDWSRAEAHQWWSRHEVGEVSERQDLAPTLS